MAVQAAVPAKRNWVLMPAPDFEALLEEFNKMAIGPLNKSLLDEVVKSVAKNRVFPATLLTELGIQSWDENGRDTLLNAWVADRLLGQNSLLRLYQRSAEDTTSSRAHLKANLTISLKQYMSDMRGIREERNLWRRLGAIATSTDEISHTGSGSSMCLSLNTSIEKRPGLDAWDLRAIANRFTDEELELKQIHSGNRATSPINDVPLKRLLIGLLNAAEGQVDLADAHKAICLRLSLPIEGFDASQELALLAASGSDTAKEALKLIEGKLVIEAAADALDSLQTEEVDALRSYFIDPSFASVGRQLKISENTARNRCRRGINHLVDSLADYDLLPTVDDGCQKHQPDATILNMGLEALRTKIESAGTIH